MNELIIGIAILYIFLCWMVRVLILEVDKLTKENRELKAANDELIEINFKLTKK